MTNNFDLIVVGAGPSGSATAYTAAGYGISVLLLEEHPEIGLPVVCAEGISRSTIIPYLEIKPDWVAQNLDGAIIRGPFDDEFVIEYPGCGWVLKRNVFDKTLAKMAEARGALVKTSVRAKRIENNHIFVQEAGREKKYRFKFIVGADGIASRVGKWLGIDTRLGLNDIAVCAEYLIEDIMINPRYASLIFGHRYAPGGYAWIFPKSDHAANIGLGISPTKTTKKAKDLLDTWVTREFPQGKIKQRIFGGVPSKVFTDIVGKNFFLVGDAARLTDPLSGAGITNGIKSGVIAGHNVVLRLKGKKHYFLAEIKKSILNEIKFHLKVRNVYWRLTDEEYDKIFQIGKKVFVGRQVDDINIKQLVKEILLLSPKIMLKWFGLLF
jgi:digeranylgeranylglycerophospholipid reductase